MAKRENIIDPKFMAERIRDWAMMRKAKQEYEKLVEGTEYGSIEDFVHYMEVNYGIRPFVKTSIGSGWLDGFVSGEFVVLDKKKYMMFVLKYR